MNDFLFSSCKLIIINMISFTRFLWTLVKIFKKLYVFGFKIVEIQEVNLTIITLGDQSYLHVITINKVIKNEMLLSKRIFL